MPVKIKALEAFLVEVEYREPFTISLGTSVKARNVVVKLASDDGSIGLGEASPSPKIVGDDVDLVVETLRRAWRKLKGVEIEGPETFAEVLGRVSGSPSAKAALEMAFLDLWCKGLGVPLYRILGGYRRTVETDITIGIMSPEEQAKRAVAYVEMGFKSIKLKLGLEPEVDVERVRAVRDAVGESVRIRVDANQGWSVDEAKWVIGRISNYDVELVEQPVKWDDIRGLAEVRRESPIPIAADESVKSLADAIAVIKAEAADVINIKLMKCGGPWQALKLAAVSEAAGVKNMVGCMGETGLAITAGVHVALALRNVKYVDLDSDLLLAERLVVEGGAYCDRGIRGVPERPGLGILKINEGLLKPLLKLG